MRTTPILIFGLTTILLTSCLGDKKYINVEELGDKTSFLNTNFKGNLIDYAEGMSACDKISEDEIASLYGSPSELVHIEDPTKSDQYRKDLPPSCLFYIETRANDYEWLRGSISLNREIGKR